ACRPFDKDRDGFIYGESCAAVVLERPNHDRASARKNYGSIAGTSVVMDGNRNPDPSLDGEMKAIRDAIDRAGLSAEEIDYINPHGSGSVIGDETEVRAITESGLKHAWMNSTKSITGHGMSSAGAVELVAILIQMQESRLHPSRNLADPISTECNWVGESSMSHEIQNALNISLGFGGMNTALVVRAPETIVEVAS
ncbi:MAG: polyketide beta-ketoacyl:ACP synthase, partial [Candidatus Lindowbacteria bacterium]|nr:polyketide beta-ketoacyl:ACP synthase [Candidatus Lindowbacteria bacterium]